MGVFMESLLDPLVTSSFTNLPETKNLHQVQEHWTTTCWRSVEKNSFPQALAQFLDVFATQIWTKDLDIKLRGKIGQLC